MYTRIPCRGCGRRLKLPYGADPRKARCPSCGERIENIENPDDTLPELPAAIPPAPVPLSLDDSRTRLPAAKPLSLDESRPNLPKPKPLSLDDNVTILSLDDDDDPKAGTKPSEPEPYIGPFPPQRFHAVVLADSKSKKPLDGSLDVVVTPHGLFLEPPGLPFVYVPVGATSEVTGLGELTIALGARKIELQFVKVGNPNRLARDLSALLAGQPLILAESCYRRPRWLIPLALVLAVLVVAGPVFFARAASLPMKSGLIIGGALAAIGLVASLVFAFRTRYSLESKVLLMNGTAAALTALFGIGAFTYARTTSGGITWRGSEKAAEKPPEIPFVPYPAQPPLPPPPSYLDIAREKGQARIEDNAAAVTALALVPGRTSLLAAYADGTTRLWPLDLPTIEDWTPGPIADGPTRRIRFGDGGRIVVLAGPSGTVVTPLDMPPPAPLRIAGDTVAIVPAKVKDRDRIAVLRGNRVQVRLLPAGLPTAPAGMPVNGFIPLNAKQETPDNTYRLDLASPAKLTFLTFHPTGLLIAGQPDGSVISWPQKGNFKVENTTHKAPVRTIAFGTARPDMALGDDKGIVTMWPGSSLLPTRHAMLTSAVAALAIDSKGQRLAAADSAGNVTIHTVKPPAEIATFKASGPVSSLAFGPGDDSIIVAVGTVIEIRMLEPLLKKAPPPMPEPPKKLEPKKPTVPPKKK